MRISNPTPLKMNREISPTSNSTNKKQITRSSNPFDNDKPETERKDFDTETPRKKGETGSFKQDRNSVKGGQ